jgi:hypothetical protein
MTMIGYATVICLLAGQLPRLARLLMLKVGEEGALVIKTYRQLKNF